MHLKIVTVEKVILDEAVKSIHTQSANGEFIILDRHAPVIVMTVPGPTIIITDNSERKVLFTSTGVIRVKNQEVLFITDAAEWKEKIDEHRAQEAKEKALKEIREGLGNKDQAKGSLARAKGRLKTLKTI